MKYSAGRSGVASANIIWCASVVLPQPGGPAMTLNENSGKPAAEHLVESRHAGGQAGDDGFTVSHGDVSCDGMAA